MGPRPFSRGDRPSSSRASRMSVIMASMGPRPFSRGDSAVMTAEFETAARALQWGRDLSVAETWSTEVVVRRTGIDRCFNGAATFQSRRPN